MRTPLLAAVVTLLPPALYAPLVHATAPGAGFPVGTGAGRWIHCGAVAACALLVFVAFRIRAGADGPAFAAGLALAAFPAIPDVVASPLHGPLIHLAGLCVALPLWISVPGGRVPYRPLPFLVILVGFCILESRCSAADVGATALAPFAALAVAAAVLAGEAAFALQRRRDEIGPGVRGAVVLGLALCVTASAALGQWRARTWRDPVAFWDRAVAEDPGNPAALGASAGVRAESGDLPGAAARLREFVQALESGRDASLRGDEARRAGAEGAARAAGAILAGTGEPDREAASAALSRARTLAPRSAAVRRAVGESLLAGGDPAEALGVLEEAVVLDPGDAAAWAALSRVRLRLGRAEAGLEAAMRARGLRPGDGAFVVVHAEALLANGRSAEALQTLHDALGPAPYDPVVAAAYAEAHLRVARQELSAGLKGRALRRAGEGLRVDPENRECRDLHDRLERQYAAERPAAEQWMKPDRDGHVDPNLWCGFAVWLARWGQYDEAEGHFRRLLELLRGNAALHFQCGYELWELRGTREGQEEAVGEYRAALALEAGYVEPRARLWQCLRTLGRMEEARQEARKFLDLAREHPDAFEAERFLAGREEPR
jgi:tetratricopeptide (TPR) repeat protein